VSVDLNHRSSTYFAGKAPHNSPILISIAMISSYMFSKIIIASFADCISLLLPFSAFRRFWRGVIDFPY
jgi:hypothetical protein